MKPVDGTRLLDSLASKFRGVVCTWEIRSKTTNIVFLKVIKQNTRKVCYMLYCEKSWAENNLGSLWTMRIVEFSESLETKEDDKRATSVR